MQNISWGQEVELPLQDFLILGGTIEKDVNLHCNLTEFLTVS